MAVGLLCLLFGSPVGRAEASTTTAPEKGPLISGTVSYVDGAFVWTDYVYDDRGPESDERKGGDATYPADAAPGNAADLVQVQLGMTNGALRVRTVFNSMVDRDAPLVALGIDNDARSTTGAPGFPGGAWRTAGRTGLEHVIVLSGPGGRVLRWEGGRWRTAGNFGVSADVRTNVLDGTVPLRLIGADRTRQWRVLAAAGLAKHSFLDGSGTIFDLAFVRAEDPSTESILAVSDAVEQASGQATGRGTGTRQWQDHRQADVLAGDLHVSNAMATIDLAKVRRRATELSRATEAGFHTFLYRSKVRMGEGVQADPLQYRGVYQPYLVRLPSRSVSPRPMIVFLHGGSQNHLQTANYFAPSLTDPVSPGSFDPPAVVIFPLGRDTGWTTGPSEKDFLDATADAARRLGVDRRRIVVSGISAGATGTQRMGQFYPDRFTGLYSLAGGTLPQLFGNFANLPMRMTNGAADPFLGPAPTVLVPPALDAMGFVDYRVWLFNARSHVPIPALGNCVYRDLVGRPAVSDPPRVVYSVDPRLDVDDPERGIRLRHDRAYWASELRVRSTDSEGMLLPALDQYFDPPGASSPIGSIDVTTLARSDRARTFESSKTVHENASHGEDLCGPNPSVQTGDTWEESAGRVAAGARQPTSNAFKAALDNLRSFTLDVDRMGLRTDRTLRAEVSGDGRTTIRLKGEWPERLALFRDSKRIGTLRAGSEAVVLNQNFDGTHLYELRPLRG